MSADDILADLEMVLGTASRRDVRAIYRAADDGGVIQAEEMVDLFPGEPQMHSATLLRTALRAAGCEDAAD